MNQQELREFVDSIRQLAVRVRKLEARPYTGGGGGGAAEPIIVTEGPDIDIVSFPDEYRVGRGGDTILLFNSDGNPIEEFSPTQLGLTAALAAASSGNTVELPNMTITITEAITIPAGVTLKGINRERSILTFSGAFAGTTVNLITVNTNSVLSDCTINATYTGNASAIRTVFLVLGRAYRLVINSTKESGNGDLYGTIERFKISL